MEEITFHITNNPWINNGIARMINSIKNDENIDINLSKDSATLSSKGNILNNIADEIIYLAYSGTYYFSPAFKIINKYGNSKYEPPDYPNSAKDAKVKWTITEDDRKVLKKYKFDYKIKQQVFKRRDSYLGNQNSKSDNYQKNGINFKESKEFKKILKNKFGKNFCSSCGYFSKEMIPITQMFNPLVNEHHNNKIEGIGNIREKIKICPNCFTMAMFSLFDKYIPFYTDSKRDTKLFLPNVNDLELLVKINNNLSLKSQFIDFENAEIINYSTNIKSLRNKYDSLALLTVLHNIQNIYSKDEINNLFEDLNNNELMEIVDWVVINKKSKKISRIKANSNIYKILKVQKYEGKDIYLVLDFFNKFQFSNYNESEVEKFYNSFLELDQNAIANSLFKMAKSNPTINTQNNGNPFYLLNRIFLDLIMGEINMLNNEIKSACKSVSKSIGQIFSKDIGMMTKFAYATDEEVFKQYIEEATFLMAKKSALVDENIYLNSKDLEILLDNLNKDNFKEIKNYFVSFMSSSALYNNYKKGDN